VIELQRLSVWTRKKVLITKNPKEVEVDIKRKPTMEVEGSGDDGSSSRKRRHADSSSITAPKTSLEILELVETPNFEELARQFPAFQEAWNETRQTQKQKLHSKNGNDGGVSFSSCVTQEFTIALTRGILQAHLDLKLPHLERHHLCPPVPNRFFYLHWIYTHLLPMMHQHQKANCGMDLGVGATCIYPLLASKFFHCNMVASEIDTNALSLAKANVTANRLDHKIQLLEVAPSHSQQPSLPPGGPLERALQAWNQQAHQRLDFVMTNPPFYDPESMEHATPRAGDGRARTAMTVSEGSYPGGEVSFVTEMIADSLRNPKSSLWFSSMLGKKTSLIKLQKLLIHLLGPAHVEMTEYGPGQYTRWFLAWTLEQPSPYAVSARVTHANDSFQVTTSFDGILSTPQDAVSEVVSRIVTFCESSPGGWKLSTEKSVCSQHPPVAKVQIQETLPLAITNFVDESEPNACIPPILVQALQESNHNSHSLLPATGHFVIDATVESSATPNQVTVRLSCFRHSSRGLTAIKKIHNAMEGDVCRTSRKWRRIHQRQQQQKQQAAPS
jgi:23S rRNA A1618 N6-methylase RlmF